MAKRYGQSYFSTNGFRVGCSALLLDQALYDLLVGNRQEALQYFADVFIGGNRLPHIYSITIDRYLTRGAGMAQINFHCDGLPAFVTGNAEVVISAGLRFGSFTGSQIIFRGIIDEAKGPNKGDSAATIDAYDLGYLLGKRSPAAQVVSGSLGSWLNSELASLGLSDTRLVTRGSDVVLNRSLSIRGYQNILDAANTLASGTTVHYLFQSGQGELVLLDPAYFETAQPLFVLSRSLQAKPVTELFGRYNRVPYTNYTGYARDDVTYLVTINADGSSTIHTSGTSSSPMISDIYNDMADQANNGILTSSSMQNPVPQSKEAFDILAASFCYESQRRKVDFETTFNPFVDIGGTCEYDGSGYFVGGLRHQIHVESFWKSAWKLWEI
jgi:hypothetical protein